MWSKDARSGEGCVLLRRMRALEKNARSGLAEDLAWLKGARVVLKPPADARGLLLFL